MRWKKPFSAHPGSHSKSNVRPCKDCLKTQTWKAALKSTGRSHTAILAKSEVQADPKAARREAKEQGRSTYSPQSYKELVKDAVESIEYALDDGETRMEVDFPTLSGDSKPFLPPAGTLTL